MTMEKRRGIQESKDNVLCECGHTWAQHGWTSTKCPILGCKCQGWIREHARETCCRAIRAAEAARNQGEE